MMADDLSYEQATQGELSYEQAAQPGEISYDEAAAAPPQRESGLLQTIPQALEAVSTPEGREKLRRAIQTFGSGPGDPQSFLGGMLEYFKGAGKAVKEGMTPEQETEFALNTALGTIGVGTKIPRAAVEAVHPVLKSFDEGVTAPAVQRLIPEPQIAPVEGSQVPRNVARTDLATTGEPHIDAVLHSEVTKDVIDNPIVDRSHTVPYTAGGSVPLEDPTVFIDSRFPRSFTVDGVTFDPADPFAVHENVEQHTMDLLIKGGMTPEEAYRVAHFEFAEKAEGAWYEAHGIDQARAEAEYAPYMADIQKAPATDVPSNLYKRPYPHDQPSAAAHEAISEPRPSPAEIAQAKDIIAKATQAGDLTPAGVKPTEIEARGNNGFFIKSKADPADMLSVFVEPDAVKASVSIVGPKMRGQGVGMALYERAVQFAQEKGLPFRSDMSVSNDAIRVYEGLARRGYNVETAEGTERNPSGLTNTKKGYVFEVTGGRPLAKLQQARDLGVIGPDRTPPLDEPPAKAAQRAIPAARAGDDKITMTPAGEPIDAWQARFKDWVGRVKVPDDVRSLISDAAEKNNNFPQARAGEIPAAHVQALAEAAGVDPKSLNQTKLQGRFDNPDQIRIAKQMMDQMLDDAKKAADNLLAEDTPENRVKLQEALMRRDLGVEYIVGLRAEWGKTGHALRDLLDKGEEVLSEILKDKGRTGEDLVDVARGLQDLDRETAARVLSNMRDKQPHWFYWMWQQGLISGIVTHTGYTFTNLGWTASERVLAPALAALLGKTPVIGKGGVYFGEPAAAAWGMIHAVPDAWRVAKQAFRSNMRVPLASEMALGEGLDGKALTPYPSTKPNWGMLGNLMGEKLTSKVENILGTPGRGANFQHTFFKVLNQGAIAKSLAYRAAADEGLSPLTQAFSDRYGYHIANPSDTALRETVEQAYKGSFMQALGEKSSQRARWIRDDPIFKWVFPFQHIPLNIVRGAVEYSPMAVLGSEMRAALVGEKGAAVQTQAMAKMMIGSAVMGWFVYKGFMDEATGSYPTDKKEQDRWKLLNMQPDSIKSGDQWVSLDRFGPHGIVAKMGAEIASIIRHYDGQDDKAMAKTAFAVIHGTAQILGNEPGYMSVKNIVEAIENPRQFERYIGYQVGSFMPFSSMISQAASAIDPYMREARGLVDNLKYRIPFLREAELPKRDHLYGEPVQNPGYIGQPGITAAFIRRTTQPPDPVKQDLDRVGYYPGPPQNHVGGVKLTPELYDRYQATAGPLVRQALTALVSQPGWQDVPPAVRHDTYKAVVSAMRQRAAAALQADQPQLIQQGLQQHLDRINAR